MTLVELYRRTLEGLEIVAAGETADASDTQLVASKYVSIWNLLCSLGMVAWTVTEAVPEEAAMPLIDMLKYACADEFGDDKERYAAAGAIGMSSPSLAELQLRRILARSYVSSTAASEYF